MAEPATVTIVIPLPLARAFLGAVGPHIDGIGLSIDPGAACPVAVGQVYDLVAGAVLSQASGADDEPGVAADPAKSGGAVERVARRAEARRRFAMARLRFAACLLFVGTFGFATIRALAAGVRPVEAVGVGAFVGACMVLFPSAIWAMTWVFGLQARHDELMKAEEAAAG